MARYDSTNSSVCGGYFVGKLVLAMEWAAKTGIMVCGALGRFRTRSAEDRARLIWARWARLMGSFDMGSFDIDIFMDSRQTPHVKEGQ